MAIFTKIRCFLMSQSILIVGAGLYGAVCAYELNRKGYVVTVIDKRNHIGGNLYTRNINGIPVHYYGAHIFHTSDKKIWDYINQFGEFNSFINSPMAKYRKKFYNLPFNMNTFNELWGITTPDGAKRKIESQKIRYSNPKNLEEKALSMVGKDIYYKLIKEYTEKQWDKKATELPADIITRIPIRFTYDNNYFNDRYQGIPIKGYTQLFYRMLENCEVKVQTPFNKNMLDKYDLVIYTGPIDEFFDYQFGALEYRSLKFKHFLTDTTNWQGNAVVNYPEKKYQFTRVIEHKHFYQKEYEDCTSVITYEYPFPWTKGRDAYYPIRDNQNSILYDKYLNLARDYPKVIFGGRLGLYRYINMDKTIELALKMIETRFK